MDQFELLSKPGDSGEPPVVPGKPEASALFRRLVTSNEADRMPQKADSLPADQLKAIERWIFEGAQFDGEDPRADLTSLIRRQNHPQPPQFYSHPVPVAALAFHPNRPELAIGGYHEILVWNWTTKKLLKRLQGIAQRTQSLVYSRDGSLLVAAGGTPGVIGEVALLDPELDAPTKVLGTAPDLFLFATLSPDGTLLAVGGSDGSIRLYNLPDGTEKLRIVQHADWVTGLSFSSDGRRLVSASRDRSARVYLVAQGELETSYQGHQAPVSAVAICEQNEKVCSADRNGNVHVWNLKDGKKAKEISLSSREISRLLGTQADFFAATAEGTVKRYRVADAEFTRDYAAFRDAVFALAVAPGEEHLAAASRSGDVCVWNLKTGAVAAQFLAAPLGLNPVFQPHR